MEGVIQEINAYPETLKKLVDKKNELGRTNSIDDIAKVLKDVEVLTSDSLKREFRVFVMKAINEKIDLYRELQKTFKS